MFSYDLPNSHAIVHITYLAGLKDDRIKLKQYREVTNLEQFSCGESGSTFKTIMATALAAVPAVAVSAAACMIPVIVAGFLHSFGLLGLIKSNLKGGYYHLSFPSATYLRSAIMEQASNHMVSTSVDLVGKHIFIACDKGKHDF